MSRETVEKRLYASFPHIECMAHEEIDVEELVDFITDLEDRTVNIMHELAFICLGNECPDLDKEFEDYERSKYEH